MAAEQKAAENGDDEGDEDEDDNAIDKGIKSGEDDPTAVKEKRKRKNKSRSKQNKCWIYITGLPSDVTAEELKSHFSKVSHFYLKSQSMSYCDLKISALQVQFRLLISIDWYSNFFFDFK